MASRIDEFYMSVAESWAKLFSSCPRADCGAVIVANDEIIGIGANGSARNERSCNDEGCEIESDHCVRTTHAEIKALCDAAYNGRKTGHAIAYSTQRPCQRCMSALSEAGIWKVYYRNDYHTSAHGFEYCSESLMETLKLEKI